MNDNTEVCASIQQQYACELHIERLLDRCPPRLLHRLYLKERDDKYDIPQRPLHGKTESSCGCNVLSLSLSLFTPVSTKMHVDKRLPVAYRDDLIQRYHHDSRYENAQQYEPSCYYKISR